MNYGNMNDRTDDHDRWTDGCGRYLSCGNGFTKGCLMGWDGHIKKDEKGEGIGHR